MHNSVQMEALPLHVLDVNRSRAGGLVNLHQFARRRNSAFHDHVAKENGKRLIADKFRRAEDGVPKSERFALARVTELHPAADAVDQLRKLRLSAVREKAFELR